jgi:hypothetical protein
MGAVIIETNDLEEAHPKRAQWMAQAVQAAVSGHPGAYFVSIRLAGDHVVVGLREHTRVGDPWRAEVRVPLRMPEELRRSVDRMLARRVRLTRPGRPVSP